MLKFKSALNLVKFGRIPRRVVACISGPHVQQCSHKTWDVMKNAGESYVLEFSAPYGPVKISKCHNFCKLKINFNFN